MTFTSYPIILYLTFFSLPLVATLKGKGTVVLVCLLLIVHGKTLWTHRYQAFKDLVLRVKNPVGLCAVSFAAWCFLSTLWAPDMGKAFLDAARYLILIVAGLLVYGGVQHETASRKQIFFKAFYGGFLFYAVFFLVEIYIFPIATKLYINGAYFSKTLFIKGFVNFCFLFWPFLLILLQKNSKIASWKVILIPSFILMAVLLKTGPHAALFGILLGTMGALSINRFPKAPYVAAFLFTLFSLSTPWLFTKIVNQKTLGDNFHYIAGSYQHRLLMWERLGEETLKNPLIGQGFEASTTFPKGDIVRIIVKKPIFDFSSRQVTSIIANDGIDNIFSTHPHNGIVQIWVDMGFIGIILILSVLWAVTHAITRIQSPLERSCLFGFLLFYEVIHLVGFGLWQKWIGASIILSLLCFSVVKNRQCWV